MSKTGRSQPKTAKTSINCDENEIICAVSEARGIPPTVGLAFVNISTSEAVLCQLSDTQTFARTCHKISVFCPSHILFAETATDSKLISVIRENNASDGSVVMTPMNRRYWKENVGFDYIQQLAFPDDFEILKLSMSGNYFAVCSFAAATKHINLCLEMTFSHQSLRIRFEASEGAMLVDVYTIHSLEVVQNTLDPKSKDCLLGCLNETSTKMGSRMLKSNILQPSTDQMKITKRYEAVAELSAKKLMCDSVIEALRNFVDTDKVLAALVLKQKKLDFAYLEQSVNNVIMLKSFVDKISPIWQALNGAECEDLLKIRELCTPQNYANIRNVIGYALDEDIRYSTKPTELRNQRVWALNAGVNGFLDVARQTYKEINFDIDELVNGLRDEHNIGLEMRFDAGRQFFLTTKLAELADRELPTVFINVHRNKKNLEFQTLDLIKLNSKLRDAHNEIVVLSNQSIQDLIDTVRTQLQPLFKISEAIALLDLLVTFAQLSTTRNYVQPEFKLALAIQSGRHPILDKIHNERLVPNDVYADEQSRFQIITGCNMSGKSTYIRSIALNTILAQIGCFVPAEYASFPIVHQLFARTSTDDNVEANVSTFACEMREMAFILHNIEPRSLVIVDELGRGTSTTDGLAIAIAISEALIESKAMVWFVTHFRDLPKILAERAGVVNLHLAVDMTPDHSSMNMRYTVSDGPEKQRHYGLVLARLAQLPKRMLETAARISDELHRRNKPRAHNVYTIARAKRRKLVLKLKEQLQHAKESDLDNERLRTWLKRLQEEFAIRMAVIDAELASAHDHFHATTNEMKADVSVTNTTTSEGDQTSMIDCTTRDNSEPQTPSPTKAGRLVFSDVHLLKSENQVVSDAEFIDDVIEHNDFMEIF